MEDRIGVLEAEAGAGSLPESLVVDRGFAMMKLDSQPIPPRLVPCPGNLSESPTLANDTSGSSGDSSSAVIKIVAPAYNTCASPSPCDTQTCNVAMHSDSDNVAGSMTSCPMFSLDEGTPVNPSEEELQLCAEQQQSHSVPLIEEEDAIPVVAIRELSRGTPGSTAAAPCVHFKRERALRKPVSDNPKLCVRPVVSSKIDNGAMGGFAKLPELPTMVASPIKKQGRRRKDYGRTQPQWEEKRANSVCIDSYLEETWCDVAEESSAPRVNGNTEVRNPSFDTRAATDGFLVSGELLIPAPRHSLRLQAAGFAQLGPRPSALDANAHSVVIAIGARDREAPLAWENDSEDEAVPEEGALAMALSSPARFAWGGKRLPMKIPDAPIMDLEALDEEFALGDRLSEAPTYSKRGLWTDWDQGNIFDGESACEESMLSTRTGTEQKIEESTELLDDFYQVDVRRLSLDCATLDLCDASMHDTTFSSTVLGRPMTCAFEVDERPLVIAL